MARSGIQYEDVQRAVDTLLKRHENPSVQKIREVLGTGSFTTISEHLREWRTRREEKRDYPAAAELPEPLEGWAQTLWDKAQQLAVEQLAHYREEADRSISAAQEQARQAQREAEDAAQRLAALNEHLGQVQARLEDKTTLSARLESELESTQQREKSLEQQLAKAQAEHHAASRHQERLQAEHRESIEELQRDYQARLAQEEQRHEAAEARLMALLDESRQERQAQEKQHVKRVASVEQRLERMERELTEQRRLYTDARENERKGRWERQRLGEQLEAAETRAQQAQHDRSRLEQDYRQLWDTYRELQQRLAQTPLPPFVY
ncbi:DNA-binding protein [Halomonas sp. WWR20]